MTASPRMLACFADWQRAYLTAHYAAPCPDHLMNALVEQSTDRERALAECPATNADDLLLKLFPIILAEFEQARGDAPLMPKFEGVGCLIGKPADERFRSVVADLLKISPCIAAASAAPYSLVEGTAK